MNLKFAGKKRSLNVKDAIKSFAKNVYNKEKYKNQMEKHIVNLVGLD